VLHQNKLKAPFVFEGSCNRSVFVTYLKKVLAPELKPGQTLISAGLLKKCESFDQMVISRN
jgi:hypothetical protein